MSFLLMTKMLQSLHVVLVREKKKENGEKVKENFRAIDFCKTIVSSPCSAQLSYMVARFVGSAY